MTFTLLMHCASRRCSRLVYLEESVLGDDLEVPPGMAPHGRYCFECANAMGYWSGDEVNRLWALLLEAGLLGRYGPDRPGPAQVVGRQLTLPLP